MKFRFVIYCILYKKFYFINFILHVFLKFKGYFGSLSFHLIVCCRLLRTTIRCYQLMPKITVGVVVICNPSYVNKTNLYENLLVRFSVLVFVTVGVVDTEVVRKYRP